MSEQQPSSAIPAQPLGFTHPLPNLAAQLNGNRPLRIVAIGSSSTAGEGGIVPYAYRLETELRGRFADRMVDVLNRGKGGDEAPGEAARMQTDVIDEKPALVIWQVGTNAAWKGDDPADVAAAIRDGLDQLARHPIDVVLMDLQYAPAVLTPAKIDAAERMVALIADCAAEAKVNVFRRFLLMQQWHEVERFSFDQMIDPTDVDRPHQSDWSARRLAYALADLITHAPKSAAPAASTPPA